MASQSNLPGNAEGINTVRSWQLVFVFLLILQVVGQVCGTAPRSMHTKCRNAVYPGTRLSRYPVPDGKVPWNVKWAEYDPPTYTLHVDRPWADSALSATNFRPRWNTLDGPVDRRSHEGPYQVENGAPLNPHGRTGLRGRGRLGRWGPNHAADPVVTRWKRDSCGKTVLHSATGLPILQFVAITRKDSGEWAIPGGMVDPGELVTSTLRREFCEEALDSLALSDKQRNELEKSLQEFFSKGTEVYKGYVDDPRNTDNSWMETVAYNFHDDDGSGAGRLALRAGDDAAGVRWTDVEACLPLYASHSDLLHRVARLHGAHYDVIQ